MEEDPPSSATNVIEIHLRDLYQPATMGLNVGVDHMTSPRIKLRLGLKLPREEGDRKKDTEGDHPARPLLIRTLLIDGSQRLRKDLLSVLLGMILLGHPSAMEPEFQTKPSHVKP
jgi:hypothetical protein